MEQQVEELRCPECWARLTDENQCTDGNYQCPECGWWYDYSECVEAAEQRRKRMQNPDQRFRCPQCFQVATHDGHGLTCADCGIILAYSAAEEAGRLYAEVAVPKVVA